MRAKIGVTNFFKNSGGYHLDEIIFKCNKPIPKTNKKKILYRYLI